MIRKKLSIGRARSREKLIISEKKGHSVTRKSGRSEMIGTQCAYFMPKIQKGAQCDESTRKKKICAFEQQGKQIIFRVTLS
jgi:hypothetical protein